MADPVSTDVVLAYVNGEPVYGPSDTFDKAIAGSPVCLCVYCPRDAVGRDEHGAWACGRHIEVGA